MNIKKLNEELSKFLNESEENNNTEKLDLSFQSESGWVNNIELYVPKSIMDLCRKKNIEWSILTPEESVDSEDDDDSNRLQLEMFNDKHCVSQIIWSEDDDSLLELLEAMMDNYYDEF